MGAGRRLVFGLTFGTAMITGGTFHDMEGKLPTHGEYPHRDTAAIEGIIVHHTATNGQSLKTIAQFHVATRGWPGIAYHYAIGWDGQVYLLNSEDRLTYHAQGWNTRTIGIVFVGTYTDRPPTDAAWAAFMRLVSDIGERRCIRYVKGHRDTKATACPGDSLYRMVRDTF